MYTWDYNLKTKKRGPAYNRWRIERLLKYGFGRERVPQRMVEEYLPKIRLPEDVRAFWEWMLWRKRP